MFNALPEKRKQQGLTLVEVVFAIVIMSILIFISINEYQKSTFKNQITQVKSSIEQLQMAMQSYYNDNCAKAGSTGDFGITYNGITPYLVNANSIENPWKGDLSLDESYVPSLIPFVKSNNKPPMLVLDVYFPDLAGSGNTDKQNIVIAELKPTYWAFGSRNSYIEFSFYPMLGQGQEQSGVGLAGVQQFVADNPVPAGSINGTVVNPPCNSYYQSN